MSYGLGIDLRNLASAALRVVSDQKIDLSVRLGLPS